MNKFIVILRLVIIVTSCLFSFISYAGCNFKPGHSRYDYSYSIDSTIASLSVARNQQPNTKLGPEITIPAGNVVEFRCNPVMNYAMIKYGMPMTESLYSGIYNTNIPGIGIKVWVSGFLQVVHNNPGQYGYGSGHYIEGNIVAMKAQFYVTGPIGDEADALDLNLTIEAWENTTNNTTVGGLEWSRLTITGHVPVTVKSCETPDILVDLKKHSKLDFTTVGSTSAATPFNFEIKKCSKDMAAVKYTFKPAAGINLVNPGASNQHVTLRTGSTASGVGVQVLYANDTLVPFNTAVKYTGYNASLGGDYVIPMKARFIRTGEVTPGTAESAVEFTMAYE